MPLGLQNNNSKLSPSEKVLTVRHEDNTSEGLIGEIEGGIFILDIRHPFNSCIDTETPDHARHVTVTSSSSHMT